jgi:hypothetical protein
MATSETAEAGLAGNRRLRLGAVVAVAVAVGFIAWLLFIKGDNSSKGRKAIPVAATPQSLHQLAASLGHSVYWVGRRARNTYELTRTSDGSVYIRYLPPGVALGDPRPNFLTIGTYPHPKATATVQKAARRQGALKLKVKGGLAVSNATRPQSTYVAYSRDPDLLLEIYDPSPSRSHRLANSGQVVPVR